MTTAVDELLFAAGEVEIQASGTTPSVSIVAYTGGPDGGTRLGPAGD